MSCGLQFVKGIRIDVDELWTDYVINKQTIQELSIKNKCSCRTIQRKLHSHIVPAKTIVPRSVIVIMDTTYFGRNNGVMVFVDAIKIEVLLRFFVKTETNELYALGIQKLQERGFKIEGIVCDGRKGLLGMFPNIPTQLCQFYQIQMVRRYLTQNPKLEASKELLELTRHLPACSKFEFAKRLSDWHSHWKSFINEMSVSSIDGKRFYTHKRLRSAYLSLKHNSHWLFTYAECNDYNIPNTTNIIEGLFSHLKKCLRNHNGLSLVNKHKIIDGFFKAWGSKRQTRE